jgi:hypothetical protein
MGEETAAMAMAMVRRAEATGKSIEGRRGGFLIGRLAAHSFRKGR